LHVTSHVAAIADVEAAGDREQVTFRVALARRAGLRAHVQAFVVVLQDEIDDACDRF
jgi:hypothetical protein